MHHNYKVLKIGDFGISEQLKYESELIETVQERGFPAYVAIELFKEKKYTSSADVWSMGCILFEMVHGKRLFSLEAGFHPLVVRSKLREKVLAFEHQPIEATCSPEVKNIILKCVSRNPAERPTSLEMLDDFIDLQFNAELYRDKETKQANQQTQNET